MTGERELLERVGWNKDGLADLLDDTSRFITRFVTFSIRHQAIAVALWIAHVFSVRAAAATPYLRIKSAAEESGKTTLLEVLELLLGDLALNAVSISPAAVFRARDKFGPLALLLDEVDNTLRNRQDDGARDLLALVNSGYRSRASVIRTVGQQHEPKRFATFGPAAIAGIGHLHPTTESRCIPIVLERKVRGVGERWLPFLVEKEAEVLRSRFEAWATDETLDALRQARPDIPQGLRDRQVEGWWALWALADLAGGQWPAASRSAARALHLDADAEDTMAVGVLLLAHVRSIFEAAGQDRLPTATLLRELVAEESGPWGKWWGAELERTTTPHAAAGDLARHLRPWVRPRTIRVGDETPRGYLAGDFKQAWERYLPPLTKRPTKGGATSETPATPLASTVAPVARVSGGTGSEPEVEPLVVTMHVDDVEAATEQLRQVFGPDQVLEVGEP